MSRANIGEAYYRLKYRPSASETPVADQLKEELIRLRKSTRNALQQSWDEVETLQKQCAINTEVIAQHDTVIEEMQKKEKAWQIRCRAAEAKLQDKPDSFPQRKHSEERDSLRLSEEREQSWGQNMLSFPQRKHSEERDSSRFQRRTTFPQNMQERPTDEAKLEEISEQRRSPRHHKRLSLGQSVGQSVRSWVGRNDDQNKMPIELVLKIRCRDEAISSLEQTLDENIKSMQGLQAEIQSLVVTQQMKVKKIYDSHAQKEEDFKGQVDSLRKELSDAMSRNESY